MAIEPVRILPATTAVIWRKNAGAFTHTVKDETGTAVDLTDYATITAQAHSDWRDPTSDLFTPTTASPTAAGTVSIEWTAANVDVAHEVIYVTVRGDGTVLDRFGIHVLPSGQD